MATGSYLSIITLNVNGLNAPNQNKDWLNGYKNKIPIYAVYKRPTSKQWTQKDLKVKVWKKIFHANGDQKKAEAAILISD